MKKSCLALKNRAFVFKIKFYIWFSKWFSNIAQGYYHPGIVNKLETSWLFTQPFIEVQIKEKIEAQSK